MMEQQEMAVAIARQTEQIKALSDRMGNLEKLTESVQRLAISLEQLTARQSATETQVTNISEDIEEIKTKPAKRWDTVVAAIISALIGAGIALLIK